MLFGNRSVGSVVTVFVAQCVMRGLLNVFVIVAAVGVLGVGRAGAGLLFAASGSAGSRRAPGAGAPARPADSRRRSRSG